MAAGCEGGGSAIDCSLDMSQAAHHAATTVRAALPSARPTIGLILGSGLGGFADVLERPTSFSYADLPGFPAPTVEGHAGRLVLGTIAGKEVACLQGRVHLYEGHPPESVAVLVRTLALLGCHTLVVTNAAGALDPEAVPGDLMVITDHINLQGRNPLVGPNDPSFGPRFPAMNDAYDPQLRARLLAQARTLGLSMREGVYVGVLGPSFETPAEIRAFALLGADAVGMSTVSEVIVARHCGMRVLGISVLTNLAAGLSDETLNHEQTLAAAERSAADLQRLLRAFLAEV